MNMKLMGAVCIILACGSSGFLMARHHLVKIQMLRNLISVLDYMECELQYRCTPLPQLCRQAGEESYGIMGVVFRRFAEELDAQISPDTGNCMAAVLDRLDGVDSTMYPILMELGNNLGKFDMAGQLRGLHNIQAMCQQKLQYLSKDKDSRLRSYQTLGLCAGAAIAILFV